MVSMCMNNKNIKPQTTTNSLLEYYSLVTASKCHWYSRINRITRSAHMHSELAGAYGSTVLYTITQLTATLHLQVDDLSWHSYYGTINPHLSTIYFRESDEKKIKDTIMSLNLVFVQNFFNDLPHAKGETQLRSFNIFFSQFNEHFHSNTIVCKEVIFNFNTSRNKYYWVSILYIIQMCIVRCCMGSWKHFGASTFVKKLWHLIISLLT